MGGRRPRRREPRLGPHDRDRDRPDRLGGPERHPASPAGRGPDRRARDGWGARARGVPGRRGDRVHARDGAGARGLRRRSCAPRALRAARTRAPERAPVPGRLALVGADRGGASGRSVARQARRGRAGRRAPRLGCRGARRVRPHRRVPTGRTERGRADPFGRGQRRRGVRPARGRERRPEHVRGHRPAGRAGAEGEGAVRPPGRPVRADLHPGHARGRGARVGHQRRSGPRARRAGGRDAVSADPGRADRDRRRHLASGQARDHREGRRRARDPRARTRPAVRQDRDAHDRDARARRGHGVRRHRARRGPAARSVARPGVAARARHGDRDGGAPPGPRALVPRGRPGGARRRHPRHGRRPERGAREDLLDRAGASHSRRRLATSGAGARWRARRA